MAPGPDWAESGRRVLRGSAAFCCAGGALAALRGAAPAPAARTSLLAGALIAPFLALREAVVHGARADGPVASAFVGGLAGYLGALYAVGPSWVAVTRGAAAVGAGCGLVDALVSGLDWRRKVYIVRTEDSRALAALADASSASGSASSAAGAGGSAGAYPVVLQQQLPRWARWPVWFPVLKQVDMEYQELIRRRADTLAALETEQTRIADLLKALEAVKARKIAMTCAMSGADESILDNTGKPVVPGNRRQAVVPNRRSSPSAHHSSSAGMPRTLSDVTDSDPASPPASP
jgi:hypothetical protein